MSGVKGIIGMHGFNVCLVVVFSLSRSGVKTPLLSIYKITHPIGLLGYVSIRPSIGEKGHRSKH